MVKYVGLILFLIGVCFMGLSYYISDQVKSETGAYYEATDKLSDNPIVDLGGSGAKNVTKEIGSGINHQVAKKAAPYEKLAAYMHNIGIFLIVLGGVIALFVTARKLYKQ